MMATTADLCDRFAEAAQACVADWRSYGGRMALYGRVQTLRTFEDAALIRQTLGTDGAGRVLVIDAGGSRNAAVLGDNMARLGIKNGWQGVLIYGVVRDVDILRELDFGVHALGAVPVRGGKSGVGEVGAEILIGGVAIQPGDFIAMDSDGVVICAAAHADEVLAWATATEGQASHPR